MLKLPRSAPLHYIVAFATVGLALLITLQLQVLAHRAPYALFFAAVIVSTWYGGRNVGFVAIILSVVATAYFVIPPLYSVRLADVTLVEEGAFIAVALLITFLISARQRSHELLRESEEHYRLLFERNPLPMWVYDCETLAFLAVNEAAIRHYGYSKEEFLSMTIKDIRPAEDVPALQDAVPKTDSGLSPATRTWRHVKKDGTVIEAEITSYTLMFGGRSADLVLANDVTARKHLATDRERFLALGADLLVIAGFDGMFKWVSPAWERTLGWSSKELTFHPWLNFVHPEDQGKTVNEAEKLFRGQETISFENRYLHKDGSYRWLSWKSRPFMQEQLLYAVASDVTERKLLEDQLRQSQKLESIGQLAGGVAHDFNNLLTVITGYSQLALHRLPPDSPLRNNLKEITNAGERAASLTRQLLAFSRKQVMQPKVIDLGSTVSNLDKMLQRLIGEDIKLVTMLDKDLAKVYVDPNQMEQVLMNLAVNARDAMPNGGKLTIETKNVFLDEAYTRRHVSVTPGKYVMLAVSDTGHGMDAETQSHIFEPFFTTKEAGKGTGLGLAMVYGIVKQSDGNIWVYSEPGHGTTFKIYLPITRQGESEDSEATVTRERERGTETILLVEDEAAVRTLLMDILQSEGYTVLEAANGPEALERCGNYEGPIDLLVTDVIMPEMSGPELVKRLSGKCRELKVLYISGYTDNAIVHHGVLEPGVNYLQKPFTPNGVANKIREVLNNKSE
ncbi:MAG TPA: PAS domain S-box protein [Pyrinomonadaceae bacterium]|nr:PAS domain S-box protein [Pyrinomonadaceae bacterium]